MLRRSCIADRCCPSVCNGTINMRSLEASRTVGSLTGRTTCFQHLSFWLLIIVALTRYTAPSMQLPQQQQQPVMLLNGPASYQRHFMAVSYAVLRRALCPRAVSLSCIGNSKIRRPESTDFTMGCQITRSVKPGFNKSYTIAFSLYISSLTLI